MKNSVRDTLQKILVKYPDIYLEPARLESLLRDYLPEGHKLEIHLLIRAIDEKVVKELIAEKNTTPGEILIDRLTRRLMSNCGLSAESATWAVDTWALVLGIVAPDDSWEKGNLSPGGQLPKEQPQAFFSDHINSDSHNCISTYEKDGDVKPSGIDGQQNNQNRYVKWINNHVSLIAIILIIIIIAIPLVMLMQPF